MKTFLQFFTLLKEGGNLFPDTRRINKNEVMPTIEYLETLTGLALRDKLLGSTGKAETSGDIDVGVDATKITKDQLIQNLSNNGVSPADYKKTGIEVGLKTPIYKSKKELAGGFVQVDFMFHDDINYLKWFYANNEALPLKGKDRNILLSSIAKAKNLTISINGLTNRETKLLITRNPDDIAKRLFDEKSTAKDVYNIPNIIAALKRVYKDENIVKQIVEPAEATSGVRYI